MRAGAGTGRKPALSGLGMCIDRSCRRVGFVRLSVNSTMKTSLHRLLQTAIPASVLLTACAHPGGSGSVGGGGGTPPPPPVFTIDDLNGDWVGQLTPDNPARLIQNVYLRFVDEDLVEAADSAGNEWRLNNSERSFSFDAEGMLEANLGLLVGVAGLEIQAQMDQSRTVLSGSYVQVGSDLFPVAGTLELVRSSGAGMFEVAMLEGAWTGDGTNAHHRRQILELTLDATGTVVTGAMIRPGLGTVRRTYSAGAAVFNFSDGAIGRMDDVTLTSDDGAVTFLHYLLVDRDATLLAGPGTDQRLGAGLVRLNQ